jgi:NCAIR mutase (PurE)-related protein
MKSENTLEGLLLKVKNDSLSVEEAALKLRKAPFVDLGYAQVDTHRELRQGVPEVIYGAGKTAEQILGIAQTLRKDSSRPVLITRLDAEKAKKIQEQLPLDYHTDGRIGLVGSLPEPDGIGTILILAAGTSDRPVAEEAIWTARALGNEVKAFHDVGVAGLHRLLAHLDDMMQATVIIAIAGMEGALASVVGGLVSCPVIAVPTSVGYGAAFGGMTALCSMLNSCASGVSVVNIDNGFGAAYQASLINHIKGDQ